jgi:hypothetical protein
MWMHAPTGRRRTRRGHAAAETPLLLIPHQRSESVAARVDRAPGHDVRGGIAHVEEQLRRLEVRLLAEAGGDPDAERAVRHHLDESRARFTIARVRQFIPILVEREVRRRLRDGQAAADLSGTAEWGRNTAATSPTTAISARTAIASP